MIDSSSQCGASRPACGGAGVSTAFVRCRRLPAFAQPPVGSAPAHRKKTFTDGEIIDGFLKTAFGAEYHLAGRVDRIRKYQMPVRVFVDGATRPTAQNQIAKVVTRHRARGSSISTSPWRTTATTPTRIITLVRDRDLQTTITAFYETGESQGDPRLAGSRSACSGFRKNEAITRSNART